MNQELQYRTFEDLMDSVRTDFKTLDLEGMIEDQELIKIALKINAELGLRVNPNKQGIFELSNYAVRVPADFQTLNFVLFFNSRQLVQSNDLPKQGGVEFVTDPDNACGAPLVVKLDLNTHCVYTPTFKYHTPCRMTIIPKPGVGQQCFVNDSGRSEVWLDKGFLHSTHSCGYIYVNYQGSLEDEQGRLLVADHPFFNEYYEYAVKQRILENLLMNGEAETNRLSLIEQRLRPAKNQALSYKNTPDFNTLKRTWEMNRKAQYQRFYNQHLTHPIR
jgi:hypothetical protein